MFHVKICGITRVEDAAAAAKAGADCLGLNFYTASKRCIAESRAREIVSCLPANVLAAGLFVNAPLLEVCRVFDQLPLGLIQLHGDEPPEYLAQLAPRPVLRAFRFTSEGWPPIVDYLHRCRTLACSPHMVLVDAHQAGHYGGTGTTVEWNRLVDWQRFVGPAPLVLAGGLTAENVARAIGIVRPAAVDTASGVESAPGIKDHAQITSFVHHARAAFAL